MSLKVIEAVQNKVAGTQGELYTGEEKTLGELVFHIRTDRKISIGNLSKGTGITPACIKDLESGYLSTMKKNDLDKIARVLGMSINERHKMFDLSANGKVPEDIRLFVEKNDTVQEFLRISMDGYPAKKEMCRRLMKNIVKMPPEQADRVLQALSS